jgi:hypothetical protein
VGGSGLLEEEQEGVAESGAAAARLDKMAVAETAALAGAVGIEVEVVGLGFEEGIP